MTMLLECDKCKTVSRPYAGEQYPDWADVLNKSVRFTTGFDTQFDVKLSGPQWWTHLCKACFVELLQRAVANDEYAKREEPAQEPVMVDSSPEDAEVKWIEIRVSDYARMKDDAALGELVRQMQMSTRLCRSNIKDGPRWYMLGDFLPDAPIYWSTPEESLRDAFERATD